MVDTYRGQLRVRSWPRKRGPSKSQTVRDQNDWFKGANQLAKQAEPTQMAMAIEMTLGTGLYPRDILLRQMSGGMWELIREDGVKLETRRPFREEIMFQGVSQELDVDFVMTPGLHNIIPWSLPLLDTASFWNVAAPTRLTIPAGIEVVSFTGGWTGKTNTGVARVIIVIWKNGVIMATFASQDNGTPAMTIDKGAFPVVAGDYFEMSAFCTGGQSALAGPGTFFTLNVEQAS